MSSGKSILMGMIKLLKVKAVRIILNHTSVFRFTIFANRKYPADITKPQIMFALTKVAGFNIFEKSGPSTNW